MSQSEIIAIVVIAINLVLAIGGFIVTLLMTVLGFMVKRLIKAVDDLRLSNEQIVLAINDRPDYAEAERQANKIAKARITEHERDFTHESKK